MVKMAMWLETAPSHQEGGGPHHPGEQALEEEEEAHHQEEALVEAAPLPLLHAVVGA